MVWEAPPEFRQAAEDLIELDAIGVEVVRTGSVTDEALLSLADTLGLIMYRELPGAFLSRSRLARDMASGDSLLLVMAAQRAFHSSAGPIGLARYADTSDPDVCPLLAERSARVKAVHPAVRTYYVTRFIQDDVCRDAVDFVLVDLRDHPDPASGMNRVAGEWAVDGRNGNVAADKVGIAALGMHVVEGGPSGRDVPGSVEYQARYLENALTAARAMDFQSVFVYRFRDPVRTVSMEMPPDSWGRKYGLYDDTGSPRRALQIVRGMYRGLQDEFAISNGGEHHQSTPWFTLLGWGIIIVLSVMYTGSARFRSMIPRYFLAHGFFRNAVREAREVLPLTSAALLTVTGLSIGMLAAFALLSLDGTNVAWYVFAKAGPGLQELLVALRASPVAFVVLVGGAALLAMSVWMGVWMLTTIRRSPLLPSQALMLAVWPRFTVLVLLLAAMIAQDSAGTGPPHIAALIVSGWLIAALWSSVRTSYDLYKVVHIPAGVCFLVWLLNPAVLFSTGVTLLAVLKPDIFSHVVHLIFRS